MVVLPAGPLSDSELAEFLAGQAGTRLLEVRHELAAASSAQRRDAGDRRSQELLAALLGAARPEDAVLSEEAADDPVRLHAPRVWIIDPLDGTREFAELGRDDWAVHVALWERDQLVAGAVALPARGLLLGSGTVAPPPQASPVPRLVVSRTRPPPMVDEVARRLGAEIVSMGSAGAKTMAVVLGEAEVYLHAGGQYEWDSAAPVAVAAAAGLHTSRIDGSPLRYNQPDPLLPDLLVCRPELAGPVLAVVADQA